MAVTAGTLTIIVLSCILLIFVIVYMSLWFENKRTIRYSNISIQHNALQAENYNRSLRPKGDEFILRNAERTENIDTEAVTLENEQLLQ